MSPARSVDAPPQWRTPKRSVRAGQPSGLRIFNYYAGFSEDFASDAISYLHQRGCRLVLDPWNGSGTTTAAAARVGLHSSGIDILLPMTDIAVARSAAASELEHLDRHSSCCVAWAEDNWHESSCVQLGAWLYPSAAKWMQALFAATFAQELNATDTVRSSLRACLIETLLSALQSFRGTNPTWVRTPASGDRLRMFRTELSESFTAACQMLLQAHKAMLSDETCHVKPKLDVGTSTALPIADGTVDAILTSPPYCTRIDYVVNILPALKLYGLGQEDVVRLRTDSIGSPVVSMNVDGQPVLPPTVKDLLERIEAHDSHASRTYYVKFFRRYFVMMEQSLVELTRVARPGATAILVVQDSRFKDIQVNTTDLLRDSLESHGWTHVSTASYKATRLMRRMNPGSRAYATGDDAECERVLVMRRTDD